MIFADPPIDWFASGNKATKKYVYPLYKEWNYYKKYISFTVLATSWGSLHRLILIAKDIHVEHSSELRHYYGTAFLS